MNDVFLRPLQIRQRNSFLILRRMLNLFGETLDSSESISISSSRSTPPRKDEAGLYVWIGIKLLLFRIKLKTKRSTSRLQLTSTSYWVARSATKIIITKQEDKLQMVQARMMNMNKLGIIPSKFPLFSRISKRKSYNISLISYTLPLRHFNSNNN